MIDFFTFMYTVYQLLWLGYKCGYIPPISIEGEIKLSPNVANNRSELEVSTKESQSFSHRRFLLTKVVLFILLWLSGNPRTRFKRTELNRHNRQLKREDWSKLSQGNKRLIYTTTLKSGRMEWSCEVQPKTIKEFNFYNLKDFDLK